MTYNKAEEVVSVYNELNKVAARINAIEDIRRQAESAKGCYPGCLNILQMHSEFFEEVIGSFIVDTLDIVKEVAERDLQKAEKRLVDL